MKFSSIIFTAVTALVLFGLTGKIFSPAPYPDDFNSHVKLTSLVSSAQILERPPILIPLPETEKMEAGKKNKPSEPIINAASALIFRLENGRPMLKFNSSARHPIASLTKLMTAVVAIEKMSLSRGITLNEEDIYQEGAAGNFAPGEVFSLNDMINAMLVSSSNDAAHAISRVYGQREFTDAMQEKTVELNMRNTTFAEAIGFTSLNQSTAEDMAELLRYIQKTQPNLLKISTQKEAALMESVTKQIRNIKNINKFAEQDDFQGGKTGYTEEAGGNLVSIFKINGADFGIIILGSENPEARFEETKKLYDWLKSVVQ